MPHLQARFELFLIFFFEQKISIIREALHTHTHLSRTITPHSIVAPKINQYTQAVGTYKGTIKFCIFSSQSSGGLPPLASHSLAVDRPDAIDPRKRRAAEYTCSTDCWYLPKFPEAEDPRRDPPKNLQQSRPSCELLQRTRGQPIPRLKGTITGQPSTNNTTEEKKLVLIYPSAQNCIYANCRATFRRLSCVRETANTSRAHFSCSVLPLLLLNILFKFLVFLFPALFFSSPHTTSVTSGCLISFIFTSSGRDRGLGTRFFVFLSKTLILIMNNLFLIPGDLAFPLALFLSHSLSLSLSLSLSISLFISRGEGGCFVARERQTERVRSYDISSAN